MPAQLGVIMGLLSRATPYQEEREKDDGYIRKKCGSEIDRCYRVISMTILYYNPVTSTSSSRLSILAIFGKLVLDCSCVSVSSVVSDGNGR